MTPTMGYTRFLITMLWIVMAQCVWVKTSYATVSNANSMPKQNKTQISGMVVTTYPLYLIAKAVTNTIETPVLLLAPNQTGHDVQLKPQDLQQLKQANFVLWFGTAYEQGLAHILKNQPNSIALFELNAFKRLPLRNTQGQPLANTLDPHLWLDPVNASAIAHAIAAVRGQQFPNYAAQYKKNAVLFSQNIATVQQKYAYNTPRPYWAYHDAYQYLEQSLNLQFKGSLTVDHHLPPTLKQLQWLQQQRMGSHAKSQCLLAEGKVDAAIINRLQPVNVQLIDETMQAHKDFITAWQAVAQQLINCA